MKLLLKIFADANGVEVASGKVPKPKQLRMGAAVNAKDSVKANI